LTFSNLNLETEAFFTVKPYTRIEGADQPDTETASFPEGVYRMEVSPDEMVAHGAPPDLAQGLGGVNTLIFDDGTFSHVDPAGVPCPGTYTVIAGGRVALYYEADPLCSGPGDDLFFEANWTLDGDQLHFTDITFDPSGPYDDLWAWFWGGQPWIRIDDASAPGDEDETSDSDG
jgi:hypothetical protein